MATTENLISSIENIIKKADTENKEVSNVLLLEFANCLHASEVDINSNLALRLQDVVNDLFEMVLRCTHRNTLLLKDQNLMYILILLIINNSAKAFAPEFITCWTIVHDFIPTSVSDIVVRDLLHDSVINSHSSWLSAMLLVRISTCTNFIIRHCLIPKGFYRKLEGIIVSNKDFTTANYLLELVQYLPKPSISKESLGNTFSINITQKPQFLRDIPSTKAGSYEILHYLNNVNKPFKNLYQLKSVNSMNTALNRTFENGHLIFLQIIGKIMIIWSSNEEELDPIYLNLNNLRKFYISKEQVIKIELTTRNESWNTLSLISLNSKSNCYTFEIELKRNELIKSLCKILRSIVGYNFKKVSMASTTISGESQIESKYSPRKTQFSASSESQLSDIGLSDSACNTITDNQGYSSSSKVKISSRKNQKVQEPKRKSDYLSTSSIKAKLRNYQKHESQSPSIPTPKFFGRDPLSVESLQSEDDSTKFKDFLENNNLRISRTSSTYSTQLENKKTLPTPTKIISDLQKVSKRYGKKIKKQSYKRDIWDFSSSAPSTPLKKPKTISKNGVNSVEPENIIQSVVPDSQVSPSLLVLEKIEANTVNEKNRNSKAQECLSQKFLATMSNSKNENSKEIPTTEEEKLTWSKNLRDNLYNNLFDDEIAKNINSVQAKDSITNEVYDKNISVGIFDSGKQYENLQLNIDNETSKSATNNRPLMMNTPVASNSTSFSDVRRRDEETTETNVTKSTNENSLYIQNRTNIENSILENTTAKTSFPDYSTSLKELDIDRQYSLIYEGLNSLSSNLINRIKKFEIDIFLKQKELHEELESSFQQIAINYCEKLKKFNNYVTKKSDEIFKDFTD